MIAVLFLRYGAVRRLLIGCCSLFAATGGAHAFGPEGHLIAGLLAEPLLCSAARNEIRALDRAVSSELGDFAELGLWADRIRSVSEWRHTGPWHYMNIERDAPSLAAAERAVRAFAHPPEGDVLWAIEHFSEQLENRSLPAATRADALRFLVHFVVDIHQPLHVGRAADRGGNMVDVTYDGTVVNLHRFWDTEVIALADLSPARYARRLATIEPAGSAQSERATWAAESLFLRAQVYRGVPASARVRALSADYLQAAQRLTERRLREAGERLAATLNSLLCAETRR